MKIGLFIFGFAVMILGGCSEENTESKQEKPKEEVVKTEATPKKEVESKKEPEKEAKKEDKKPEAVTAAKEEKKMDTDAIKDYSGKIYDQMGVFTSELDALTAGNFELSSNPGLVFDYSWKESQVYALIAMEEGIKELRAIQPSDHPLAQQSHDNLMIALDYYEKMVNLYPVAIDEMIADKMDQCTEYINKGSEYLRTATAYAQHLLEEMNQNS